MWPYRKNISKELMNNLSVTSSLIDWSITIPSSKYIPQFSFGMMTVRWQQWSCHCQTKIFYWIKAFTLVWPSSPGFVSMPGHPTNKFLNSGELWNNHEHKIQYKNLIRESRIHTWNWEEHPRCFLAGRWGDWTVIQLWLCCLKLPMSWWSELWCALCKG